MRSLRRPRQRCAAALAVAVATASMTLAAAPADASAQADAPPVTTPDQVTTYPGNQVALMPLANDTDPDTKPADLAICRMGTEHYRKVGAAAFGQELDIASAPNAKPGTYTFTYYACDFSTLVPGTVTVNLEAPPDIKVTRLGGQPGKLRVTNPADFAIRFLYGSFAEPKPDGKLKISAHSSTVISVHRTTIQWVAIDRSGQVLTTGEVKGIALRRGDRPSAAHAPLSRSLAEQWSRVS